MNPDATTNEKCPHCGAEHDPSLMSRTAERYECESVWCFSAKAFRERSALCKEREARQKAEAEIARLREELNAWDYGTRAKREQEARKKAESSTRRVVEIAGQLAYHNENYPSWPVLLTELAAIKATLPA